MKMKAYFFYSILFFTVVNSALFAQKNQKQKINDNYGLYLPDRSEHKKYRIDSLYDVTLNGCKQKILVQSNNTDNPVLLYLHGGPGSSIMMRTHVFSDRLKDHFIFVNWDQRGTALSYHEGMDTTKISEDQLRDDVIELIKYLQNKFNHKKVYLIGHSFGSVLGLQLVADHPEYFAAYIGVGQVAYDWDRSVSITYSWLHDQLVKANDTAGLRRIEADKFPYIDLITKYGGHHRLTLDPDSIIRTSPYYFEGYFDKLQQGKDFSVKYMGKYPGQQKTIHKSIWEIHVPLYFFEGVNDHVIV
jgi:pimeloyl-ACP methyl ester carboxylesterase